MQAKSLYVQAAEVSISMACRELGGEVALP